MSSPFEFVLYYASGEIYLHNLVWKPEIHSFVTFILKIMPGLKLLQMIVVRF